MLDSSYGVCVSLTFSRPSKISFFVRIFYRGRERERERVERGTVAASSPFSRRRSPCLPSLRVVCDVGSEVKTLALARSREGSKQWRRWERRR